MEYIVQGKNIIAHQRGFSLKDTLDCGQCFRFEQDRDGKIKGFAQNHFLCASQDDNQIVFDNMEEDEFNGFWRNYLDFDRDYNLIKSELCRDEIIAKACEYAGGIHIVKQDPWEALCSFIISQNNNIPRIKGIISRLCEDFGEQTEYGFAFPSAETIADCSVEALSGLRAGFRAKYILDASCKIASGAIDLKCIAEADINTAREMLKEINGVGPKVAECALLFGFNRLEAFPVDVWIKRVLEYFYKSGVPEFIKPYGGIAQQFLFHYIRTCPEAVPEEYRKK